MIATAYSVQTTLRMRSEEQAGRAEPVLAGALSRWRWAGSHLQVVVAGTLVVLAAAGLGTGVTYGLIDGDAGHVPRLLAASLVHRSEEHTSELQSLMRISYAVFCLKKKTKHRPIHNKK